MSFLFLFSLQVANIDIKVIDAGYNKQENGYEDEIEKFSKMFGTVAFKEEVKAFLEKRKANFPGN
jgi:enoyl-CoA hydratase